MSALVKQAISDLSDALDGIDLTSESIKETVGPVPANASIHELRRAAHSLDAELKIIKESEAANG